jgi:hypothetical protein
MVPCLIATGHVNRPHVLSKKFIYNYIRTYPTPEVNGADLYIVVNYMAPKSIFILSTDKILN